MGQQSVCLLAVNVCVPFARDNGRDAPNESYTLDRERI